MPVRKIYEYSYGKEESFQLTDNSPRGDSSVAFASLP